MATDGNGNKIRNYGLHNKNIELQSPDLDISGTQIHYLGERYITDFSGDVSGQKNNNGEFLEISKPSLISLKEESGTIFDKSNQKSVISEYKNGKLEEQISEKNIGSGVIDENDFYVKEEKNYSDFNPSNKASGLYTATFEPTTVSSPNSLNILGIDNKDLDSDKVLSYNEKEAVSLSKNIIKDRKARVELKDIYDDTTVGKTPWIDKNDFSATVSNVDSQDDYTLDDIENYEDLNKIGKVVKNSFGFGANNIGIVNGAKSLINGIKPKENYLKYTSDRPGDGDYGFEKLSKAKSEKYKNIKLSSKLGTYNSLTNLLGCASGMFVGSLGKSMVSNMFDDMTAKFTGGLGIAGIAERLSGAVESVPSLEDIVALNLVNYYNMYTAKPGRTVTDRYNRYNFITPNTESDIEGKNKQKGSLQNITNIVNDTINFASSWIDGSKISDLVGKATNKKGSLVDVKGDYIVSVQRKNAEGIVYDNEKGRGNKGQTVSIFYFNSLNDKIHRFKQEITNDEHKEDYLLGGIYVEPYYNSFQIDADKSDNGGLSNYFIPFQTNPNINDGGYEARYQTEEIMGRLLQIRSYIGTNANTITIQTKYIATDEGNNTDNNSHYETWMKGWTPEKLYKIENMYKKLVLPFIYSEKGIFVKPPIVRLNIGYNGLINKETVSSLFSYPNVENSIQVTETLEGLTKEKRYIVTNLQINPINQDSFQDYYIKSRDYNNSLNNGFVSYRRGFSVSLTLAETTKNFLDNVPNYYNYSIATNKRFEKNEMFSSDNYDLKGNTITPIGINLDKLLDIKNFIVKTEKEANDIIDNLLDDEVSKTTAYVIEKDDKNRLIEAIYNS